MLVLHHVMLIHVFRRRPQVRLWRLSSCLLCLCTPGSPPRCSGSSCLSRPSSSPPSITPCCCSWPGLGPCSASASPSSWRVFASLSTCSIWLWCSAPWPSWKWCPTGRLWTPPPVTKDASRRLQGTCNPEPGSSCSVAELSSKDNISCKLIGSTHTCVRAGCYYTGTVTTFLQNLCLNWISASPCDLNEGENIYTSYFSSSACERDPPIICRLLCSFLPVCRCCH